MKKGILFLLTSLLFTTFITAQIQVVPKIGWNKYNHTNDGLFITSKEKGYQIGLDLRIGGIHYLQTGAHLFTTHDKIEHTLIEYKEEDLAQQERAFLRTLRVPLRYGHTVIDLEAIQFHTRLGVVGSFPVQREENAISTATTLDDYKKTALGGSIGLGFDIFRLTFDIDYEHGLTEVFEKAEGTKNKLWSFSLGYLF